MFSPKPKWALFSWFFVLEKRFGGLTQFFLGKAAPVVLHGQIQKPGVCPQRQANGGFCISQGVGNKIIRHAQNNSRIHTDGPAVQLGMQLQRNLLLFPEQGKLFKERVRQLLGGNPARQGGNVFQTLRLVHCVHVILETGNMA